MINIDISDPALRGASLDEQMRTLDMMRQELLARQQTITQLQQLGGNNQSASASPIWDEIDKITGEMTEGEFSAMAGNQEYIDSSAEINAILTREYMRIMRPIVESSADGKAALERHQALVKRLRKAAAEESNRAMELFREYTTGYSHITYQEFLQQKIKDK